MKKLDKKNIEDILALTPMQEGMLYHYLRNPQSNMHFEQLYIEISGKLDTLLFQEAWEFVIHTNEMLRTVFRWEKVKEPTQIVLKNHRLNLGYFDLSNKKKDEKRKLLEEIKDNDKGERFDLSEVPFRVTLCKIEQDKYGMFLSSHHILYDGWSNGIILKEFFNAYNDLSLHQVPVKPAKGRPRDFVRWLQTQDTEDIKQKQEKFWKEYLEGFEIKPSPEPQGYFVKRKEEIRNAAAHRFKFQVGVKREIEGFIKRNKVSLASLLYAAWGLLLQRYHDREDVLFDITISGRSAKIKGIEHMVGLFINTLPLRINTHPHEKIINVLYRINNTLKRWEEFKNTSPAFIKECLEGYRSSVPFDSVVVLENYPLNIKSLEENSGFSFPCYSSFGINNYDLTIIITIFDHIEVNVTYNQRLLAENVIEKISFHFEHMVKRIIGNPGKTVEELVIFLGNVPLIAGENSLEEPVTSYAPPCTEVERKLVKVWSALLGRDTIGIDDDFFDFGGHSLKASLLTGEIHRAFQVKVPLAEVFRRPTVRELAHYITTSSENNQDTHVPIRPEEKKEYYQLSPSQKRLYMIRQLNPESTAYNGQWSVTLEGQIHKGRIGETIKKLISWHESLRTSFKMVNGQLLQKIHDEVEFEIEYQNTESKAQSAERKKGRHAPCAMRHASTKKNFIRPFDLSQAPLLRVGLVKLEDLKHILMMDMHHIIIDGTSVDILTQEFVSLYKGEELPPVKIQYKDFSEWQGLLSGELPVLNMPLDFPRPTTQCFEGDRVAFELDNEFRQGLNALMRGSGTTLYMVLLAAYSILLSRYTGQEDIIVGTPAAGRNHTDLRNTVGFFLETLAVRTQPGGNQTLEQFLKEVKRTALGVYENQDYPFDELIKPVWKGKDLSRNPLFDVMLNVLNQDRSELEIEGITVIPCDFTPNVSKVDLTLEAKEVGNRVILELEYCTALFEQGTIERFSRHLVNILRQVIDKPGMRLSEIEVMSDSEKRQILEQFNDAVVEYARDKLVHELFAKQAERTPDQMALIGHILNAFGENISLTYRELNRKSNQVAYLLIEKGVQTDTFTGIMVERSVEMIIGILGILKAGGAYLPIDPGYPEERINYMLSDSGAKILISEEFLEDPALRNSSLERGAPKGRGVSNLAYIIYTSGTTGRPKGVMVQHRNLLAYLAAFEREFKITHRDIVLQQASYSFDAFVEEVFPCLLKGGCIVIPPRDVIKDSTLLSEFIYQNKVSIINCSPLLLSELNKQVQGDTINRLSSIHTFISGGDVLKGEYIDNLIKIGTVYNTYGPTEATVCASYYKYPGEGGICSTVPIGKPISNYNIYILDIGGRLQPVGVSGELCIGGAGATRGYLNRPELTAEKFGHDLWDYQDDQDEEKKGTSKKYNKKFLRGSGKAWGQFFQKEPARLTSRRRQKLYRTGDLARWLMDGNIEFLGRIDRQVNIRGFRIELGEIESRLMGHEGLHEVVARVIGDNAICVYFTAQKEKTVRELRDFLSLGLPAYMIPSYFVRLERLPLTPAGKININALPDPGKSCAPTGVEYAPPGNETQKELVRIWQNLVGRETIGIDDNFFQLGGNSLSANQCILCIREEMQVEISLKEFFEQPTIRALSREFEKRTSESSKEEIIQIKKAPGNRPIPLSFSQERLWFLQQLDKNNRAYFVPDYFYRNPSAS
jgi:fengycin family lipopeptide synthetase D